MARRQRWTDSEVGASPVYATIVASCSAAASGASFLVDADGLCDWRAAGGPLRGRA
jgi:hypothetical protein